MYRTFDVRGGYLLTYVGVIVWLPLALRELIWAIRWLYKNLMITPY